MPRPMITINIRDQRRIERRFNNFPDRINNEIKTAIRKVALINIETRAKMKLTRDKHIDTGRLRASIHTEYEGTRRILPGRLLNDLSVIVGTNIEYAIYVERIDSYLIWAYNKAIPVLQKEIKKATRRAL